MTPANGYPSSFKVQQCGFEGCRKFVGEKLAASENGACLNLHVIEMVPVAGRLVSDCTGTCYFFDILVYRKHN